MELKIATEQDKIEILEIIKRWGSEILVSKGNVYNAEDLDGILAYEDDVLKGIALFYIKNDCEILLLETFEPGKGIGTLILEMIKKEAIEKGCKKIRLLTTNSNVESIKYFQKRGFKISNVYVNSVDSRQ